MKSRNYKLITTPLFYANSSPHIGHAFTILLGDVINRVEKQKGTQTLFVTGLDEHGEKVEEASKKANQDIKSFLLERREEYKCDFASLNINYDFFQATSSSEHKKFVRKMLTKMNNNSTIYKGTYTGYYSVADETFLTSSQVENFDGSLISKETKREVTIVDQDAYFLKIEDHKKWLLDKLENDNNFLMPLSKKNEVVNMLTSPEFSDLCISRLDVEWGVKLPFDKQSTLYVWVDALLGYYSATNMFFNKWEKDVKVDSLHLVGKEIVKFHSVYLPIMLDEMSFNCEFFSVFSHGWILMDGQKMSKSLSNTIKIERLVNRFGTDATRYYLINRGPIKNDAILSEDDMKETIENDLVNKYSNLIYRTTSMIKKYSITSWKKFDANWVFNDSLIQKALSVLDKLNNNNSINIVKEIIEVFKEIVSIGNSLIDDKKPWSLHKKNLLMETEWTLLKASVLCGLASLVIEPVLTNKAKEALESFSININELGSIYSNKENSLFVKRVINIFRVRVNSDISTTMLFKRESK